MRKPLLAFAIVFATAHGARADGIDLVTKLGFRVGYGAIAVENRAMRTTSLEVGIEHPVFDNTRVFGEWEWLWLSEGDPAEMMASGRAPTHGSGQRLEAGLRHAIWVLPSNHSMRFFLDGELGGGVVMANEDTLGTHVVPDGIAGLRLGYDFRNSSSTSRVFEAEILLRAVVVPSGTGLMVGVGMLWGD